MCSAIRVAQWLTTLDTLVAYATQWELACAPLDPPDLELFQIPIGHLPLGTAHRSNISAIQLARCVRCQLLSARYDPLPRPMDPHLPFPYTDSLGGHLYLVDNDRIRGSPAPAV